jgi:hypothetical protein
MYYIREYDDDGCWLAYSQNAVGNIPPVRKTVASTTNSTGVVGFHSDHIFGHNESVVFEGDDVATIGLVAGTTYYVNMTGMSSDEMKLYDAPDTSAVYNDVAVLDATSPSVTVRRADSGTHGAVSWEQDGKRNPFPPGFNYPNHDNVPVRYQPYDGPMQVGRYPKQGVATGLAQWHAEYAGDVIHVHQCAIGGTSLAIRDINTGAGPLQDSVLGSMWYDPRKYLSWAPADEGQTFGRLKTELRASKRAAAVEGDTLECLGVYFFQGESDAIWEGSAAGYEHNLNNLTNGTHTVWTLGKEVNEAIQRAADADPYMRTVVTSDATFLDDNVHHDGAFLTVKAKRCFNAWLAMERGSRSSLDVCKLALANIGDSATITSVDPPDESQQARLCSQYYDLALKQLLNRHNWDFAQRRVSPTAITTDRTEWLYSYALPGDFRGVHAVLTKDATDDVTVNGTKTTRPYSIELDSTHTKRLYCNEEDVILRYYAHVADPSQWSESFVIALAWQLAAMIAPPLLKGEAGMAAAKNAMQLVEFYAPQAAQFDARTTREKRTENDLPEFYR